MTLSPCLFTFSVYSIFHSASPLSLTLLSLSALSFLPSLLPRVWSLPRSHSNIWRERKKERGNTLHDQSGVTRGWVLQGLLMVRIEKYMTDFLVNYPKWVSRKCCLMLTNILVTEFFSAAHMQTDMSAMGAHSFLSLSLSRSLFTSLLFFTNTHSYTQKLSKSHFSSTYSRGISEDEKNIRLSTLCEILTDVCVCLCACVRACVWPQRYDGSVQFSSIRTVQHRCPYSCLI